MFLKNYLEDNGYSEVHVESSPYLRSLQTAAETARELGQKSIRVNYLLSEWMKDTFFDSNPLEHLLIRKVGEEDVEKGIGLEE